MEACWLGIFDFVSFLKSLTKQRCDGEGENNNNKKEKGQVHFYALTPGDGNVFQKIRFPRGRDLDLHRAGL